jgi:hypothetical protein
VARSFQGVIFLLDVRYIHGAYDGVRHVAVTVKVRGVGNTVVSGLPTREIQPVQVVHHLAGKALVKLLPDEFAEILFSPDI